ncbi:hypothetical protein CF326_g7658 [Tilletia indica]|nr:hypothetical protein CF326_g7658 [Tilletia indica]
MGRRKPTAFKSSQTGNSRGADLDFNDYLTVSDDDMSGLGIALDLTGASPERDVEEEEQVPQEEAYSAEASAAKRGKKRQFNHCICGGPDNKEMIKCDYNRCENKWVSGSAAQAAGRPHRLGPMHEA